MIIVGNHLRDQCGYCGKWVRLTGFLAGWHLCLTTEERRAVDHQRWMVQQQQTAVPNHLMGLLGIIDRGKMG